MVKNNKETITLKEKLDFIIKLLLVAVLAYGVYSYNCNASKWMSKKCCKGKYYKSHSHHKKSSCSSKSSCGTDMKSCCGSKGSKGCCSSGRSKKMKKNLGLETIN